MGTKPTFISGEQPDYPDEARALGHHGEVRITVTIDEAGAVTNAELGQTSHSDLLDASALETARGAKFTPALDTDGRPMPLTFLVPYTFDNATSSEPGGGLVRYGCSAFTRDMDWWDSLGLNNENGKPAKTRLETMLLGFRVMFGARGLDGLRTTMDDHDRNWAKAREKCRANPDKLLIDYLDNRKEIERLSKIEARRAR